MIATTPTSSRSARLASAALWAIVLLCCALPIAWLLSQLILHPQILADLKPTRFRLELLGRTILYNAGAALLALLHSLPAALVIGRGRGRIAAVLCFLIPITLLLPSVTYTYAWVHVYDIANITPAAGSAADILRCIVTLGAWLWGLPALTIGLALRYLDSQVQQQSLLEGALWRTTLRQLLFPILASFFMVLILAVQEFAVYEKTGISVLATEVRTVFETGAFSSSTNPIAAVAGGSAARGMPDLQGRRAAAAVTVSLPMLLLAAVLTLALIYFARRSASADAVESLHWPRILEARWLSKSLTFAVICLTLFVPLLALVLSISSHRWQPDAAGHAWPLRIILWASPWATGSILVATLAALAALAVAALASFRAAPALLAIAIASFLIGGELLGIASIRLYNRSSPAFLARIYDGLGIMIIAYLGRFAWLALLAGNYAHTPAFAHLREIACLDGASAIQTTTRVIWPLVWPILLASSVLVAILSLTEVGATVLISPQRPQLLVPVLMTWVHMLRFDDMLEGSLFLAVIVVALGAGVVLLIWAGRRLTATLRRPAISAVISLPLLLTFTGCGDPKEPDAVWMETGLEPGQTTYPRGITYHKDLDCFFVVDRSARIQRVRQGGEVDVQWRMPKHTEGKPVGLSIGPDGNVYIADTHYARVMVYSPAGKYLREWGTFGQGPGQFTYPMDVAFDSQGNVYVAETGGNDRIQAFTPDGQFLRQIGQFGSDDGQMSRPVSLLIDGDLLYVTDASNHRIGVFTLDGRWVRSFGEIGSGPGQFRFPYGLDKDSQGNLVVAEFGNNRIQVVDKTGKGLRTWGAAGRELGQLAYPWAVAVDKEDRIVAVDSGNNRLQVFR